MRLPHFAGFGIFRNIAGPFSDGRGGTSRTCAEELPDPGTVTREHVERVDTGKAAADPHQATMVKLMSERQLTGPVITVAYDSGDVDSHGLGSGGDFLLAYGNCLHRLATFRAVELPPPSEDGRWNVVLAVLDDAFDGEAPLDVLRLFDAVSVSCIEGARERRRAVRTNAPPTHAVGVYLNAIDALTSRRPATDTPCSREAHGKAEGEPKCSGRYRYEIDTGCAPWQVDLRSAIRDAVFDLAGGETPECVSVRFENTIAIATADVIRAIAFKYGGLPVVLTGCCFENGSLNDAVLREIANRAT
jgi:hydrogenase maturation factor HypF (carbamoyltransferase family)